VDFFTLGASPLRGDRAIRSNSSAPAGLPVFPLLSLALPKIAIHGNFGLWVLQSKTQEVVAAGLLPARLRRQTASRLLLGFGFASQTQEIIDAGIHAFEILRKQLATPASCIHACEILRKQLATPANSIHAVFRQSFHAGCRPGSTGTRPHLRSNKGLIPKHYN
jgi:hypothetical protein